MCILYMVSSLSVEQLKLLILNNFTDSDINILYKNTELLLWDNCIYIKYIHLHNNYKYKYQM